ncbi:MAG TPA: CARDB domain-containing protein, partial [Gemmataceae bacterium]|nr:CARDB domain-containing protein [Gemmataceae bacterium]
ADRAAVLGPGTPTNLDQARELIAGITLNHLATDFLPGITAAAQILEHGQSANKELYLLSDMQKLGWDSRARELQAAFHALHERATVHLVRCGQHNPRNAAIVGIVPQSGIPHTGERAGFAVLVRNSGSEAVRNLTVSLTVDGHTADRESQPVPELAPGQTQAVALTARLSRPGLRVLSATLQPDELAADNRFDQIIQVRDRVRLLVVDGAMNEQVPEKSSSFYLMHALLPVKELDKLGYYIQPLLVPPQQAVPALLADKDLCILVNVDLNPKADDRLARLPEVFLDRLAAFVRAGHGLVIFGGDRVKAGPYNNLLYRQQGLLPAPLRPQLAIHEPDPLHLDRNSASTSFFTVFREDDHYKGLSGIAVRRHLDVEELPPAARSSEAVRTLLRYQNGRPAILGRKVEAGEVLLVTTSADLSWSDWPLWRGMYVPLIDILLNHLLHGQTGQHNVTAGAPLRWRPADRDAGETFVCVHPDGTRERLGIPQSVAGRPLVTAAETPLAGVYHVGLAAGSRSGRPVAERRKDIQASVPFAVVPDLREGEDLQCLSDAQIDARLGFTPIHLLAGPGSAALSGSERFQHEWTLWLLAGVLGLLLVESSLAWLCGRAW